ncbi:unnamed protein product [Camellia sinensis]
MNWVWLRPKQIWKWLREQGFKGNPYKLLYGDTKEMISMIIESISKPMDTSSDDIIPHVLPPHHHNVKLHGKHYFQWIGLIPQVNISDPKLIKEILLNYEVFQKTGQNPLGKLLLRGVLMLEGQKWVKHRNVLNPAFYLEKLKHMVPAMCSSCGEMISKWEVLVSTKESCEVDVWPYLQNDIWFLPTKTNVRMKTIHNEVRALLSNIIKNKERTLKGNDGDNDLLGILLKTNLKESQVQGNKNIKLTMEEVIVECKLFFLARQETTSALLVWTMILLSKHQKWQALARDEVFAVFGDNKPNFEGLNQLKTGRFY